jgi:hypothetical protein
VARPDITSGQIEAIKALHRDIRLFVDVWDGSQYVDLTDFEGHNWVNACQIEVGEQKPALTLSLELHREIDGVSLAPLMSETPLIRRGAGVLVGVEFRESGGTWTGRIEMYSGRMNNPSWGGDDSVLRVEARSILGRIHDLVIDDKITYEGQLETVAQQVLNDWVTNPGVAIQVEDDPDFTVQAFEQPRGTVLRAVTQLYDLVGFWLTEKFRASQFRVIAEAPPGPEEVQTPVDTVTPRDYYEIPDLQLLDIESRHQVSVIYQNPEGNIETRIRLRTPDAPVPDLPDDFPGSILDERGNPLVASDAIATALGSAALRILSRSPVIKRIHLPLDPRWELGDWIKCEANGIHYDEDFEGAVTNVTHVWSAEAPETVLEVRAFFGGIVGSLMARIQRTHTLEDVDGVVEEDVEPAAPPGDADWYYTIAEAEATQGFEEPSERDESLGGYTSTTRVTGTELNDIFRGFTTQEQTDGQDLYRVIALVNSHDTLTWESVKVWLSGFENLHVDADLRIGLDPAGVVDLESETVQGTELVDEETAPTGVTFTAPSTLEGGLEVGDLGPRKTIHVHVGLEIDPNFSGSLTGEVEICAATCPPSEPEP